MPQMVVHQETVGAWEEQSAKYHERKVRRHKQLNIYKQRALMEDPSLEGFELEKRIWDMLDKENQLEAEDFKAKGLLKCYDPNSKARGIKDCLMEDDRVTCDSLNALKIALEI